MKKILFVIIEMSVLLFFFVSCTSKISITELFDSKLPFAMRVSNKFTDHMEIQPETQKHIYLIKWLEKNSRGWKSSIASYNADISLTQNDFRLLYSSNGLVVIGFKDKSGDSKQFTKKINQGELDFLLKD